MKYILFFIFLLIFNGCGSSGTKIKSEASQGESSLTQSSNKTVPSLAPLSIQSNEINKTINPATISKESNQTIISTPSKQLEKVITIYIHGYDQIGYKIKGIYGDDDPIDNQITNFLEFSNIYSQVNPEYIDNTIVSPQYYGDTAPDYYTKQDIKDIENIGIGIPRYALIIAKYAKHIMEKNGAEKINILSASMGSLVTRYMVEKNLENIASDKKIARWLSVEGVIRGNYAASNKNLVNLVDIFEKQSPDVEQMSYSWIEKNLGNVAVGESPYYKNIIIGFETSTKDNALNGLLSGWLVLNDKFRPNDGYQVARDTYFRIDNTENMFNNLSPTHTYFNNNHLDLIDNKASWIQAISFFTSKKRVKITLTKATVYDIHEKRSKLKVGGFTVGSHDFRPAEILFASSVISPKVNDIWGVNRAIDERVLSGGALKIYKYANDGDTQEINQELFNDFIIPSEDILTLNINAYEIDRDIKYNMHELTGNKSENLGGDSIDITIQNGTYPISTKDWSGEIKVEVFKY